VEGAVSAIGTAKQRVMEVSRRNKLEHFYSLCDPGRTVLDVGVSAEHPAGLPGRNYFLKHYRFEPRSYTGLGVQDLTGMPERFPGKTFVRYPGGTFPFTDKAFDWVFSNAVVEHVGDESAQIHFINELMRVSDRAFFTTPAKFFPVESHTNVILLHWNNGVFYPFCRTWHPWATPESLFLLSHARLDRLMRESNARHYSIHKHRLLGWPMTFTVVCND
jgi:hypothetical protein